MCAALPVWPLSGLGHALEALARLSGLSPRPVEVHAPPEQLGSDDEEIGRWIGATATWMGIESDSAEPTHGEIASLLRATGPALFRLPGAEEPRFLAILEGNRRRVTILGPDLEVHRLALREVRDFLCQGPETELRPEVDQLLRTADLSPRHQTRAREAILRQRLGNAPLGSCWFLRLSPSAGLWRQVRRARLLRPLATFVGAHAVRHLLWILSWTVIGWSALQGRADPGWLVAWVLLLLTMIPLQLLATWSQGLLAVGAGALVKQRLMHGALQLDPQEIHHRGSGQLLGRVLESEAMEALALNGGFMGILALVEIAMAAAVLSAGNKLLLALLLAWLVCTALLGWRYLRRQRLWVESRLEMTDNLVEGMIGHRTRLAQELLEHRHRGEDEALTHYLRLSAAVDRHTARLLIFVARGWLLLGLAGLVPAFVWGDTSSTHLAISLGGILLAFRALHKLARGILQLAGARIAWEQVAPLFRAADQAATTGPDPSLIATIPAAGEGAPFLSAHDLSFRYPSREKPVLRDCSLDIRRGDRILLEGPSGSGKSTLASLLTGLRTPDSGLLLLDGLDRQTLGAETWHRRLAAAPQFHENHVFTDTFAFNLLMARGWPPREGDLEEAEEICRELGLGDLLERMPAGLLQQVGETGWQLSHGERSRLYIARALLQNAELIVLDESFAALDPQTLEQALRCVLNRAPSLLVIAHP